MEEKDIKKAIIFCEKLNRNRTNVEVEIVENTENYVKTKNTYTLVDGEVEIVEENYFVPLLEAVNC